MITKINKRALIFAALFTIHCSLFTAAAQTYETQYSQPVSEVMKDVAKRFDVKFKFDLDSDGKMDEISFAGEGSGFLALDKDGNGKIDDGSELFGTKSGDGFADLAAYDQDGNSWIDENDEIYSQLKVWTKDADGNDKLMNLKEANVGAIYLGSASTEFSIKDETNTMQGAIRKTGNIDKTTSKKGAALYCFDKTEYSEADRFDIIDYE